MHGHKYAVDATVALRQTNLVAVLTPANDDALRQRASIIPF
ncbi:hypothetical protein OG345_21365 [Streptomyces sp. NBC_01220]|nr:hypothetical protein OG345_21365 [Streptomyces sp. NBC_01220]